MANKSAVTKVKLGLVQGGRRTEGATAKQATEAANALTHLVASAAPQTSPALECAPEAPKDYFVERNGVKFAGTHLLVELWNAKNLDDVAVSEHALREAATAAGATILHVHLHRFSPSGGLSGVVVLAESHISIHTWPERGYAALDLFMCGTCDPYKSIPVLRRAFEPGSVQLSEQKRGVFG